MKKLLLLAMTFVMMFSFTACSGGGFLSEKDILDVTTNPEVTITLEYDLDDGDGVREVELVFELFYNKAPSTVANFIKLAKEGKSAKEIKEILEETAKDSSIYIMVSTLKYHKFSL